jgi:hypothetical protein
MPMITTAKCDRCEAAKQVPEGYEDLDRDGWVHVRLMGWTDVRGNQTMPEGPNEWLVCPTCKAELIKFLGPCGTDFYGKAGLRNRRS